MPRIRVNEAELYYEEHGTGPDTIVFAHGFLFSGHMYDDQVNALKNSYRCVTFDFRGQGQSEVTPDGYDMETLFEDAIALIERLDCAPCHFVGLSMGGFVGMRLAARQADLLRSLVLIGTSADVEVKENLPRYKLMLFVARWLGPEAVAGRVMPIMFGQTFLNDPARAELREEWRQRIAANHRIGIARAGLGGTLTREGVYDELDKIRVPTLIIAGEEDMVYEPAVAERMHARIPDSRLLVIPNAGHTSTVEEPEAVNAALEEFLRSLG